MKHPKLLIFVVFIIACNKHGEDSSTNELSIISSLYASTNNFPDCNNNRVNQLVYSKQEEAFYYCENFEWEEIQIKGEKGDTGDAGTTGETGSAGESGSSTGMNLAVYTGTTDNATSTEFSHNLTASKIRMLSCAIENSGTADLWAVQNFDGTNSWYSWNNTIVHMQTGLAAYKGQPYRCVVGYID